MISEIQEAVKSCQSCQFNKLTRIKIKHPMILNDTAATAFDKVCLHTVGPLERTANGNVHILTMQDNLSKFCLAMAVPKLREITIADAFLQEFITKFGCPRVTGFSRLPNFSFEVFLLPLPSLCTRQNFCPC